MPVTDTSGTSQFSAAQLANARTIIAVGRGRGMSERDIEIALSVALDESSLRNYANSTVPASLNIPHQAVGHDTDSLGLFQQRPSAGWGTVSQLMSPAYAAGKFYDVLKAKVPNRDNISPWIVAQTVQVSGTPSGSNYEAQWPAAQRLYEEIAQGVAPENTTVTGATGTDSSATDQKQNVFDAAATALSFLTNPADWKRIGLVAIGVVLVGGSIVFVLVESKTGQAAISAAKSGVKDAGETAAAAALV